MGFVQGNFNCDNTLIAGRTMDYGPFGWIEKFEMLWNMWAGGGDHFGFMNQPTAGGNNLKSLVEGGLSPIMDEAGKRELVSILQEYDQMQNTAMGDVFCRKLGLQSWDSAAKGLTQAALELMQDVKADYTIFWRQLSCVALDNNLSAASPAADLCSMMQSAIPACELSSKQGEISAWLQRWLRLLQQQGEEAGVSRAEAGRMMQQASPKYVPREWMLVDAYDAAVKGDYGLVHELHQLFERPYDEQPEFEAKYYKPASAEVAGNGGVAFMT